MMINDKLLNKIIKKNDLELQAIKFKGLGYDLKNERKRYIMYIITKKDFILSNGRNYNKIYPLDNITEIKITKTNYGYEVYIYDKNTPDQFIQFMLVDYQEFDEFFDWFQKSDLSY